MNAFGMPKGTPEEKEARSQAIQDATKYATEVPMRTIETSFKVFEICEAMINKGNPASVSDAGVGVLCARAAVHGAYLNVKINASSLKDKECLNVKINASSLKDKEWAEMMINKAHDYVVKADQIERRLMKKTEKVIG